MAHPLVGKEGEERSASAGQLASDARRRAGPEKKVANP
jgi:hypothetical protein